jgi:hypothetical protein
VETWKSEVIAIVRVARVIPRFQFEVSAGGQTRASGACCNTRVGIHSSSDHQEPARLARVGIVITDRISTILSADAGASALLNVAGRSSRMRQLTTFFTTGRRELLLAMQRLHDGGPVVEMRHVLRPRERRPVEVVARLSAMGPDIRWELHLDEPASSAA